MRTWIVRSLLLLAIAPHAHAAPEPVDAAQTSASTALGSVVADGRVMQTLRELTDRHPHRMTGTDGLAAATLWAEQQLRDAGVTTVRREAFTMPNRWSSRAARAELRVPRTQALAIAAVPWSTPTSRGGIEADVVTLSPAQLTDFATIAADAVRDRIVIASARFMFTDMARIGDGRRRVAELHRVLESAGARAILWGSMQPNNVVKTVALLAVGNGTVDGLPAASVGMEDMLMLRRLVEQGPVRLHLALDNAVGGPFEAHNVIGELRGRDSDEVVLVGAHLDAWPQGSGANDNGIGVAAVIETARALASAKTPPRRTVRFALWAGEEQGMLGAAAYARAHADELDSVALAINYDHGAGKPKGWSAPGRPDLAAALVAPMTALGARFGAGEILADFGCNSDAVPFVLAGVPTLELAPDETHYFDTHHLPSDTFEKIDPLYATANAALLAAATAFAAEASARLVPRHAGTTVDAWVKAERQEACRDVTSAQ